MATEAHGFWKGKQHEFQVLFIQPYFAKNFDRHRTMFAQDLENSVFKLRFGIYLVAKFRPIRSGWHFKIGKFYIEVNGDVETLFWDLKVNLH